MTNHRDLSSKSIFIVLSIDADHYLIIRFKNTIVKFDITIFAKTSKLSESIDFQ